MPKYEGGGSMRNLFEKEILAKDGRWRDPETDKIYDAAGNELDEEGINVVVGKPTAALEEARKFVAEHYPKYKANDPIAKELVRQRLYELEQASKRKAKQKRKEEKHERDR